jgi:hypothetical protein
LVYLFCRLYSQKEATLNATTSHILKFMADFRHLATETEMEKEVELSNVAQLKQNLGYQPEAQQHGFLVSTIAISCDGLNASSNCVVCN